jgi:hypothetical protein
LPPLGVGGAGPRLSTVLLEDWLRSLLSVLLLVLLLPPPICANVFYLKKLALGYPFQRT